MTIPVPSDLAVRYYRSGNLWWIFSIFWNLLVPWLFLSTGAAGHLRRWATRSAGNWYVAFVFYFTGFLVYLFLMGLPISFAAGYLREHAYGLSDQLFSKWLADHVKSLLVTIVMGALTIWVPYLLLRKAPRRWWWITGALAAPYFFFVMLVEPVWIEPLFNHFGRLQNHVLEEKILSLAHRAGVDADRVYEVNKSVDTKHLNAYVTGVLGTKRIVLWDTLLRRLDEREILSVMGHEMGHYALGHVVQGILITWALTFLGLFLIHLTGTWAVARYGLRWGFTELADFASLPLAILLIHVFSVLLTPFGLAFSRHIEHEADRFALEITHDNDAFQRVEATFVEHDLSYPYPEAWVKWLRYSHPPTGERFDFGGSYRPWEAGQPEQYAKYFRP